MQGHVDVRGIDRQQQSEQAPAAQTLQARDQHTDGSGHLSQPADDVHGFMCGECLGHHGQVRLRIEKMIQPRDEEEHRQKIACPLAGIVLGIIDALDV